jgi:oxygen-dependent protoporphyrinogen oxidase
VKYRGFFAPRGGMQNLFARLEQKLRILGVVIKYNILFEDLKNNDFTIWCTGVQDNPHLKEKVETLPLISATLCFRKSKNSPKGFGCLFPKNQGLNSLGVLFNSNIFSDRAKENYFTETWLLGGAKSFNLNQLDDVSILELIKKDRKIVYGGIDQPVEYHIKKWNSALPHYSVKLEKILENFKMPENQYAQGNYVAGIGLSKLLENSKAIAERVYNEKIRISKLS